MGGHAEGARCPIASQQPTAETDRNPARYPMSSREAYTRHSSRADNEHADFVRGDPLDEATAIGGRSVGTVKVSGRRWANHWPRWLSPSCGLRWPPALSLRVERGRRGDLAHGRAGGVAACGRDEAGAGNRITWRTPSCYGWRTGSANARNDQGAGFPCARPRRPLAGAVTPSRATHGKLK